MGQLKNLIERSNKPSATHRFVGSEDNGRFVKVRNGSGGFAEFSFSVETGFNLISSTGVKQPVNIKKIDDVKTALKENPAFAQLGVTIVDLSDEMLKGSLVTAGQLSLTKSANDTDLTKVVWEPNAQPYDIDDFDQYGVVVKIKRKTQKGVFDYEKLLEDSLADAVCHAIDSAIAEHYESTAMTYPVAGLKAGDLAKAGCKVVKAAVGESNESASFVEGKLYDNGIDAQLVKGMTNKSIVGDFSNTVALIGKDLLIGGKPLSLAGEVELSIWVPIRVISSEKTVWFQA
uniref:Uncharacterized protein n=1 Tax=Vibrio vulnificus TaxID=672 RepID=Q2V6Q9_VIBVL|nr:hypothetical protein [Vibrio vulnificus]ABB90703.1 unknown [Vibrio vulnificus]